jgi:hypothetical protein
MIEIAISSELAAEHPRFMSACLERGHQIEVFESSAAGPERAAVAEPEASRGDGRRGVQRER